MSKNDGSEIWFAIIVIVVLGIGYGMYSVLKGWADALGLDVHAVFYLVSGVGTCAIAIAVGVWMGWPKAVFIPWLLPAFGLFCLPALTYWATPQVGPFGRSDYETDIAWYGGFWSQSAIIVALGAVAFGIMKWLDDDYR